MFVIPEHVTERLMKRYPDRCVVWILRSNGAVEYDYISNVDTVRRSVIAKLPERHADFLLALRYVRWNNGSWVKAWAIMRLSDGVVLARSR